MVLLLCRAFHSTAPFVCPGSAVRTHPGWDNTPVPIILKAAAGGGASLPLSPLSSAVSPASNVTSVTLLLDSMNKVLSVDKAANQMRVQAGMLVTHLLEEATAQGLSVPLGAVPAFGDLTLGGVLVTGAHGSGHLSTSCLVRESFAQRFGDALGSTYAAEQALSKLCCSRHGCNVISTAQMRC